MPKIRKEYFIFFFVIVEVSCNYLSYPFKTRETIIKETKNKDNDLLRSLTENNIYFILDVGNPKQEIDTFIRMDINEFHFSKSSNDSITNSLTPLISNVNSNPKNFYDAKKSSSSLVDFQEKIDYKRGGHISYLASDTFSFQIKENFKKEKNIKKKMNFYLYNSTTGNMPGVIGLKLPIPNTINFIDELKSNGVIHSSYWTINYTSDDEGYLILGEQPHVYDPINYNISQLKVTNMSSYITMKDWGIRFNEITFQNKNFRPFSDCYLSHEINYIGGIPRLEKILDEYFNSSISSGVCYKKESNYLYAKATRFFSCDKSKYSNKIKDFPPLYFESQDLSYKFVLEYKDLWIEKDNKLILLIFFGDFGINWHLGKPFLKKYQFVMNQDEKSLGFYNTNSEFFNENKITNENNKQSGIKSITKIINDNIIIIGIIILVVVILFIICIVVKKNIKNKKRKKKINELDEDDNNYDENGKENLIKDNKPKIELKSEENP